RFGYKAESLSLGSNKKVVLSCDYCGKILEVSYKNRNKCYKKFPKDACKPCGNTKKKVEIGNNPSGHKYIEKSLKKQGTKHYSQSQECKKKYKNTSLKRYGVEHPSQRPKVKEKLKKTLVDRYGVEYLAQSEEMREKASKTNLERYGVEWYIMKK